MSSPKCSNTFATSTSKDVSDHELIQAAIRGMMADLDPHSAYLAAAEFDEIRISSTGEYSGVGIEVALQDGVVRVVTPIEDTPAERAGVLAGDTILAIDDVPVDIDNLNDTIDRMRGRSGTQVKITIARSAQPGPLEFTLARASVQVNSVRKDLIAPDVGYVRITHFSETTTRDLERALAKLRKENSRALHGLVLDLRNNPGGVLEAAIGVSDVFLEERRHRQRRRPRRRREVRSGRAAWRRARRRAAGRPRQRRFGVSLGNRGGRSQGSSVARRSWAGKPTARAPCRRSCPSQTAMRSS